MKSKCTRSSIPSFFSYTEDKALSYKIKRSSQLLVFPYLKHDRAKVRPQDLRVRVVLHLVLERLLRVESETLPRFRSARSASTLLS